VSAHEVTTLEGLRAIYEAPLERSVRKELDHIDEHCKRLMSDHIGLGDLEASAAALAESYEQRL
jgi:hypothetical protein